MIHLLAKIVPAESFSQRLNFIILWGKGYLWLLFYSIIRGHFRFKIVMSQLLDYMKSHKFKMVCTTLYCTVPSYINEDDVC